MPRGDHRAFARQPLPSSAGRIGVAESKIIYLNRDGITLRPGNNDSRADVSSIIDAPVEIAAWDVDDDTWRETFECFQELYAPFDVYVTDDDPGDAPHIEAVFGGSPLDVGLPENVAGVSPFTTDCSIIENSIVFTFTDALPYDARTVCEVMAQEVAHSFGLDHEMLRSDPMTYLAYIGDRSFQDEMATCGELEGRMCGIAGSVCRKQQNSYQLLGERLGFVGEKEQESPQPDTSTPAAGCNATGASPFALAIVLLGLIGRRSSKRRASDRCRRRCA